MPNSSISPERQTAYYVGHAISGVGVLLFLSTFFVIASAPMHQASFTDFNRQASAQMTDFAARAIGGMVLIVIGQVIANIGKFGPAGSGVVFDPQQARKDVEPWSRMVGGVVNDALEEIQPNKSPNPGERLTMLKDLVTDQPSTPAEERPAIERLSEIKILLNQGMLTPEEYEAKRKAIIDSI
ncbi:MAG: hypothetical protein CBB60_001280 [Armatimonadetes bacterium Cent15-Ar3]|nr:MAG: hypothetical protein CBB60_001280 [Armatimonadetes bacterium Cent15-Ar3]